MIFLINRIAHTRVSSVYEHAQLVDRILHSFMIGSRTFD